MLAQAMLTMLTRVDHSERLAQANYYRDPLRIDAYLKHGQWPLVESVEINVS